MFDNTNEGPSENDFNRWVEGYRDHMNGKSKTNSYLIGTMAYNTYNEGYEDREFQRVSVDENIKKLDAVTAKREQRPVGWANLPNWRDYL